MNWGMFWDKWKHKLLNTLAHMITSIIFAIIMLIPALTCSWFVYDTLNERVEKLENKK